VAQGVQAEQINVVGVGYRYPVFGEDRGLLE